MFVDEATLKTLTAEGKMPDSMGFVGLWKIVVVKNLPFSDLRRVGKIPNLLSHRLFTSASISFMLRLQLDPLLILEYFLWRKGYEYAISNHYDRHCVWEEVAQNKKLSKYNHTVIDTSTIMKMNVFEYFGCNLGGVRVEVLKRAPNRP
ncbi:putative hexosyltransferase MUCI70 [Capsicum annuum]|uniref:probable hexosyltransferase MUCI70 n=1 Tax=Capsicum annuum TaxID=4072 RepID=UPI001FB09660|nr:probable hexosyltransferase MUCI70 [Capsicum annuum]XP_047263319.1 probable hexosyltransferase MUCI70 [Capsicum annuum]XP_047263320.1 probable hexosyltransferase MUCI70 [Capsicum annuum]XP_047263321.1 probable hexosyltransferase MUCI70 [Capsicum annuum]